MLASVAERVYWLARYLERAEDSARLLMVRHYSILDLPRYIQPDWGLLLEVLGAQESFGALPGAATEMNIVNYVFSERANPSSIFNSLVLARENTRTTREVLPSEIWEQVNRLYLSVARRSRKSLPRSSRHAVLNGIVSSCQQISGMLSGTMSHDEAYQFMRMGRILERADMTTRIIDVGSTDLFSKGEESLPYQNAMWISVLQSLSAHQMYRLSERANVHPADVVHFLLRSDEFPRALAYSLSELEASMHRLPASEEPLKATKSVSRKLRRTNCRELQGNELHDFLDNMQLRLQNIHQVIGETWFRHQT